jgi:cytochrome b involved in lipid metabolism
MVQQGANLVLLNELVLDIQDYDLHHPGGKFMIRNNIGRDISKFYYGGYAIQDNPKHIHSNQANCQVF